MEMHQQNPYVNQYPQQQQQAPNFYNQPQPNPYNNGPGGYNNQQQAPYPQHVPEDVKNWN